MGVAGLEAVRRCPLSAARLSLEIDLVRGGVAGTSPAALAIAMIAREINFIADSRGIVQMSSSSSLAGGDGASCNVKLPNSGRTPASPAGLGAEGGSMVLADGTSRSR